MFCKGRKGEKMEKKERGSSKRMKAIVVAFMTILVCVSLIVTGTFALFTDSVKVSNHLKAGKLDAVLTRTDLIYTTLKNEVLQPVRVDTDLVVNGTTTADANVFGISDGLTCVVPGSYFEATMLIENKGNVAFDYSVEIVLTEGANTPLARQIKVTVTDHTGNVGSSMLKNANDKIVVDTGATVKSTSAGAEFKVKVQFVNITTDESNNDAMENSVKFDLVVNAIQSVA
jgi:predicted ribosomally synthesized peptide with SipW-like signal peptide